MYYLYFLTVFCICDIVWVKRDRRGFERLEIVGRLDGLGVL